MKHLNPRQGITSRAKALTRKHDVDVVRVKHLNPRQGITSGLVNNVDNVRRQHNGVKHLNPRQGITRFGALEISVIRVVSGKCETPKSPPGDYKRSRYGWRNRFAALWRCETPKSPPGDYKQRDDPALVSVVARWCETPKSPPGDYKPHPNVVLPRRCCLSV